MRKNISWHQMKFSAKDVLCVNNNQTSLFFYSLKTCTQIERGVASTSRLEKKLQFLHLGNPENLQANSKC